MMYRQLFIIAIGSLLSFAALASPDITPAQRALIGAANDAQSAGLSAEANYFTQLAHSAELRQKLTRQLDSTLEAPVQRKKLNQLVSLYSTSWCSKKTSASCQYGVTALALKELKKI